MKVKKHGGLVHYMVGCRVCNPDNSSWHGHDVLAIARKHTQKTGHETWVELGHSYRFTGL